MPKLILNNVVWREGKNYVAWCLNTGVSSFGKTKKEALASLQEALELYFDDERTPKFAAVERLDIVRLVVQHA